MCIKAVGDFVPQAEEHNAYSGIQPEKELKCFQNVSLRRVSPRFLSRLVRESAGEPPASVTLEAAYARVSARAEAAHFRFSFEDFAQMYLDEGYDSVQEYERCWLDALPLANDRAASRIVDPITEQYTMQGGDWGSTPIPNSGGKLMKDEGCAVTLAANIAYTRNNFNITPGTIIEKPGNFSGNGLLWGNALADVNLSIGGRVDNPLRVDEFWDLQEDSEKYLIGIMVHYKGTAGNPQGTRWVGASAVAKTRSGDRFYYKISRTSVNDDVLGTDPAENNRYNLGWKLDTDGNVFVPVGCVVAYRVFTVR
jgi:hypothetical protein